MPAEVVGPVALLAASALGAERLGEAQHDLTIVQASDLVRPEHQQPRQVPAALIALPIERRTPPRCSGMSMLLH